MKIFKWIGTIVGFAIIALIIALVMSKVVWKRIIYKVDQLMIYFFHVII